MIRVYEFVSRIKSLLSFNNQDETREQRCLKEYRKNPRAYPGIFSEQELFRCLAGIPDPHNPRNRLSLLDLLKIYRPDLLKDEKEK